MLTVKKRRQQRKPHPQHRASRKHKAAQPPSAPTSAPPPHHNGDVLIVGARAIGDVIGQPEKRVFVWLEQGRIESAFKIGGMWGASRNALRREFHLDVD
jgi:hypothetical protein